METYCLKSYTTCPGTRRGRTRNPFLVNCPHCLETMLAEVTGKRPGARRSAILPPVAEET